MSSFHYVPAAKLPCQIIDMAKLSYTGIYIKSLAISTPNRTEDQTQLLKGYRATFYACFASMTMVALLGYVGLKRAGRVGIKKD